MMATALSALAVVLVVAGAASLYLGLPCQQWRSRPIPPGLSRWCGCGLLALAWLTWSGPLHPVSAFFSTLTLTMLALTAMPVAAVVIVRGRKAD